VAILTCPFSPSRGLYFIWAKVWSWLLLKICGVNLKIHGREKIDWKKPSVIISNHASYMDIPCLFRAVPGPLRMLAKKELKKIPLFGWSMWMAGFIFIKRGSKKETLRSLLLAATKIKKGQRLVLFPEGTRSPNGKLQPFKRGAFVIIKKALTPVIPIIIKGSHKILPKNKVGIKPGTIEVFIGQPIEIEKIKTKNERELMTLIHKSMEALLEA
jgi:1-acyl-sn-glycerol-3-phosphate acyltransferase